MASAKEFNGFIMQGSDNGTNVLTIGKVAAGISTLNLFKNIAADAYTASGTSFARPNLNYEI